MGKVVHCSQPECRVQLRVPGELLDLQDDERIDIEPEDPEPDVNQREGRSGRRDLFFALGGLAFLAALVWGGYWWIGQPSVEQVTTYEAFLRTGNELVELHRANMANTTRTAARAKLKAKAEENLNEYRKVQSFSPRKRRALDRRFHAELEKLESDHIQLVKDHFGGRISVLVIWRPNHYLFNQVQISDTETADFSDKGMIVWEGETFRDERFRFYDPEFTGSFKITDSEWVPDGSSPSRTATDTGSKPASSDNSASPRPPLADLAGTWDAADFSLIIEPDGTGKGVAGVQEGGQYIVLIGHYTITAKSGLYHIQYEHTHRNQKTEYEFAILPESSAERLVVKDLRGNVSTNLITLQRRGGMGSAPTPPGPAPVQVPKTPGGGAMRKPSTGVVQFSELTITRTTFTPPSVAFTIRLDLAGGTLLEAWASVGVLDAGKTLEVFAGAIDQGLLEANGINFANPDPALKAQRVSMKPSAADPDVYECTVRYPKLQLVDPETEFTIVAAVRKDKEILKTNAAMVKVNLKTGAVAVGKADSGAPGKAAATEARDYKLVHTFSCPEGSVVRFLADSKHLIAVSPKLELTEWDLATKMVVRKSPAQERHRVLTTSNDFRFAFTLERADEKKLGKLHIWDLEKGQSIQSWPEPPGAWEKYAPRASMNPDGSTVAVLYREPYLRTLPNGNIQFGGEKREVFLWNTQSGERITPFSVRSEFGLAFSPDGKRLLGDDQDGKLIHWDARSGKQLQSFAGAPGTSVGHLHSTDGRYVAASCFKDKQHWVVLWQSSSGKALHVFEPTLSGGAQNQPAMGA